MRSIARASATARPSTWPSRSACAWSRATSTKHGLPAFRLVTDDGVHVVGEGEIGLTLEASRFEALRLLGSRRTMDQLRAAAFTGDLDRYLPGLVHMALPAEDLGEREPAS